MNKIQAQAKKIVENALAQAAGSEAHDAYPALSKLVQGLWDGDVTMDEIIQKEGVTSEVLAGAEKLCADLQLVDIPFPDGPEEVARLEQINSHPNYPDFSKAVLDLDDFGKDRFDKLSTGAGE